MSTHDTPFDPQGQPQPDSTQQGKPGDQGRGPGGYAGQAPPQQGWQQQVEPSEQRNWGIVSHLGGVFFSWIVPLIVMLVFGRERAPFANTEAKEALNFQINLFIGYFIAGLLTFVFIGFLLLPVLWIVSIVCSIQAAMSNSRGEPYRYPLSIRIIN